MAQQVHNLFKFRNSYVQLDLDLDQRLVITTAINELTVSGSSNPIKAALNRRTNYEDDAIIFYKEDKQVPSEYHNRPLCFTSFAHDVQLRRRLVYPGPSLNIMHFQHSRRWGSLRNTWLNSRLQYMALTEMHYCLDISILTWQPSSSHQFPCHRR